MVQVQISSTAKGYHPKAKWERIADDTKRFATMEDAQKWLKETYSKSKRSKMYCDTKDGAKHIGYVIGFHNADWSHSPVEKWIQQD